MKVFVIFVRVCDVCSYLYIGLGRVGWGGLQSDKWDRAERVESSEISGVELDGWSRAG